VKLKRLVLLLTAIIARLSLDIGGSILGKGSIFSTKQNIDGYISSRIQLLFFDSIGNGKGSIISSRQRNEDSHPFVLSIQENYIVSSLNKEIQDVEAFEGVFLVNLDIIIKELFQTTFVTK